MDQDVAMNTLTSAEDNTCRQNSISACISLIQLSPDFFEISQKNIVYYKPLSPKKCTNYIEYFKVVNYKLRHPSMTQ